MAEPVRDGLRNRRVRGVRGFCLSPDRSAASFGKAADEAGQTWRDTGRAVDDTFGPSPEERAARRQQPPGDG
ncbi:hypothetical protein [Streptomyces sp. NPDC088261]|uniref:hypothetical protein n=1 Tax=Streptomyces sp. NPDC088261 TaxID=3365851 RepID=UPI0037FC6939